MIFIMQLPMGAKQIIDILNNEGFEAYIVGGCVRDSLLGREPHDWDICTSSKPDEMLKILLKYNLNYILTGIKHGTITFVMEDGQYEVTTFRIDGEYSDGRHPDSVEFSTSIVDDLSRRDFTMNAIAFSEKTGIIDPFNGSDDIENHTIRCVGDAKARFIEDGLRILRAMRFASVYGFDIEESTSYSMHSLSKQLDKISYERITSELLKLLNGDSAINILNQYSDIIAQIIPEIKPCIGFKQYNKHHILDVYGHTTLAIDNYTGNDNIIQMALLLHDIGKPSTFTMKNGVGHFYNHASVSAELARNIVARLRFSKKDSADIVQLVRYHDRMVDESHRSVRNALALFGDEQFKRWIEVRKADIEAQSDYKRDEKLSNVERVQSVYNEIINSDSCFKLSQLEINGRDIIRLGVKSGPLIGKILNRLLNMVINEEVANNRQELIAKATLLMKEIQ